MIVPLDRVHAELWLRLALGTLTIAIGAAALAWPDVTIRIVGVLFGLSLVTTGLVRVALIPFAVAYPVPYRITAVVLGGLTAALGVVCLRHVTASAALLVLTVGIGWLLGGLTDLMLGTAGDRDLLRGWRLGIGTAAVLAAVAVLVWRSLTLDSFVVLGALFFLIIGTAEVAAGLAELRRLLVVRSARPE